MKKWVFTFNELLDFKKENFNDYTIFLKGKLYKRHDGSYLCGTFVLLPREIDLIEISGTFVLLPREIDLIEIKNSIYKDNLYLITSIDIDKRYIDFNSIGTKEDLLKYLESKGK